METNLALEQITIWNPIISWITVHRRGMKHIEEVGVEQYFAPGKQT